ncbi:hypothetical protein [Sulfurimonas sp.]|uniref:hypothetical protein n=1 Tax=Sulfurimonas sp. TaxID=2022749 RepID=UPI0026339DD7|nr:hypothetical protein [Sulfurimonas sp.]
MSSIEERALKRKNKITYAKMSLHSDEHHSFHTHLDVKSSWELLARLSQEAWKEKTGQFPPKRVDKSIVKFITYS